MSIERPKIDPRKDSEKAHDMGNASDYNRTEAASFRIKSKEKKLSSDRKEGYLVSAQFWDEKAEQEEEIAGMQYDAEKMIENLSDAEARKLCDQALTAKRDAEQSRRVLREATAKFFTTSPDLKTKLEEAEELVKKRKMESEALEHAYRLRQERKK